MLAFNKLILFIQLNIQQHTISCSLRGRKTRGGRIKEEWEKWSEISIMSVSRKDQKRQKEDGRLRRKKKKRAKAFETRIFYGRRKQEIQAPGEREESKTKKRW